MANVAPVMFSVAVVAVLYTPPLVTVATDGLLLAHVPPVDGDNCVPPPTQTSVGPVILAVGDAVTVTGSVANDVHPVAVNVKVNVADPAATPVTTPPEVTVAILVSLLVQVPPVDGDN